MRLSVVLRVMCDTLEQAGRQGAYRRGRERTVTSRERIVETVAWYIAGEHNAMKNGDIGRAELWNERKLGAARVASIALDDTVQHVMEMAVGKLDGDGFRFYLD